MVKLPITQRLREKLRMRRQERSGAPQLGTVSTPLNIPEPSPEIAEQAEQARRENLAEVNPAITQAQRTRDILAQGNLARLKELQERGVRNPEVLNSFIDNLTSQLINEQGQFLDNPEVLEQSIQGALDILTTPSPEFTTDEAFERAGLDPDTFDDLSTAQKLELLTSGGRGAGGAGIAGGLAKLGPQGTVAAATLGAAQESVLKYNQLTLKNKKEAARAADRLRADAEKDIPKLIQAVRRGENPTENARAIVNYIEAVQAAESVMKELTKEESGTRLQDINSEMTEVRDFLQEGGTADIYRSEAQSALRESIALDQAL